MTLKDEIASFALRVGGRYDEKKRNTGDRSRRAKRLYRLYLQLCTQEGVEPVSMKQWAHWPKDTDVRAWLEGKR